MTTLVNSDVASLVPAQPASTSGAPVGVPSPPEVLFRSWRKGTGRCLGSAGDLLRSRTVAGEEFQCSLPFQRLSVVDVRFRSASESVVTNAESMPHVASAALAAADFLSLGEVEISVRRRLEIPSGMGLSTDDADMIATLRAMSEAADRELTSGEIQRLAAQVGASPSLVHAGLVPSLVSSGAVLTPSLWWPRYALVVIHPAAPGVGTTLQGAPDVLPVEEVLAALESRDSLRLAGLSTQSARLHYDFEQHPVLSQVGKFDDLLAQKGLSPDGVAVSNAGAAVSYLYSMDKDSELGRMRAWDAVRVASQTLSKDFRVFASTTPLPSEG